MRGPFELIGPMMPNPAITLRAATPTDHPHLCAFNDRLIAEASLPGARPEDFARFQADFTDTALVDRNPDSRLIVAVDANDRTLGYIHLQPTRDDVLNRDIGYVTIIAVAESEAGKGIGRQLMQEAEAWACTQGYPALVLDVFASNAAARQFYAKQGFGEDSIRLRKILR